MASSARGSFPGKPRKKIQKQVVKFHQKFAKDNLRDLMQMCVFISDAAEQFEKFGVEDDDQVSYSLFCDFVVWIELGYGSHYQIVHNVH